MSDLAIPSQADLFSCWDSRTLIVGAAYGSVRVWIGWNSGVNIEIFSVWYTEILYLKWKSTKRIFLKVPKKLP